MKGLNDEWIMEGHGDFNFTVWRDYFQENKMNVQQVNWSDAYKLSKHELQTIYKSIQQFQVGESSEGKFLIKAAKDYLVDQHDKSYLQALTLFIQEEQRHARDLGLFMKKQHIPIIKKHWVDQVFRRLRRFANLEQSITVLLTAEIIATVYYDALKQVTSSGDLHDLCGQILRDEAKHVEFQSHTIKRLSKHRNKCLKKSISFLRMFLLAGTLLTVWVYHYKVLKAGGYSFLKYFRSAFNEFYRSEGLINQ
ncbi:hypothetical protein [Peribacillus sp. NPDC096540]|uniref:hypothetical protein n=1 Tax=Peribacillus sp. NPDC096540 TaxID=3390612 RepID=UPI003CFE2ED6